MTTSDLTEGELRPFAAFLQDLRGGLAHAELTGELAELVRACIEHGDKGTLRLELTVKPQGAQIVITDRVVVKAPTAPPPASIWFADDSGNLGREHPTQQSFEGLREVPPPAPARDIPTSSADAREAAGL